MQENNPVATPVVVPQSNFLVILLSILLIISVLIAGFFAYQTQRLVAELRVKNEELRIVPTVTTQPATKPVATSSPSPEPSLTPIASSSATPVSTTSPQP